MRQSEYNSPMQLSVIEAQYPQGFRKKEFEELTKHLKHKYSIQLIGMKRVGISNFLRFLLAQQKKKGTEELYVSVDLNDLIEREIYPFWTLTFKRIADAVAFSSLNEVIKRQVQSLFVRSIQAQDLFLLVDNLRATLHLLVSHDITPILFFLRFDRMSDAFTASFFDNVKGLRDLTNEKLTYVFTTYRSLEELFPSAKMRLSGLGQALYVQPATKEDMEIVYDTYTKMHYDPQLSITLEDVLFDYVAGNMQYLQLSLIILNEKQAHPPTTPEKLFQTLATDERVVLQSEELWESLTKEEKTTLLKIANKQEVTSKEKKASFYLWNTGFVKEENETRVFSPLFLDYVLKQKEETDHGEGVDLTRKEHLLFISLQENLGKICDREQIIEAVWPEYKEIGVSDWAIDRLVARVRVKLKKQKSDYEIVTVRTRGYKLTPVRM